MATPCCRTVPIPDFWALNPHFYITDTTFYNFPYTFGYLLARSLIDRYRTEGQDFLPRYEDFLRLSGGDSVENVGEAGLERRFYESGFLAGGHSEP